MDAIRPFLPNKSRGVPRVRLLADVTYDGESVTALIDDFADKGTEFGFVPSGDDHLGARACKYFCRSPSDTRACARYNCHLAVEIHHHLPSDKRALDTVPPIVISPTKPETPWIPTGT
jgi:hypothetical protein